MPRCPHCNEEVSEIIHSYHTTGWEELSLDLSDWDPDDQSFAHDEFQDRETTDLEFTSWACPRCYNELTTEEIDQLAQQLPNRENNQQQRQPRWSWRTPQRQPHRIPSENIQECPKCTHVYIDELSVEMICPRCNHTYEKNS